jgi:restriction endonuclease S subunit
LYRVITKYNAQILK